METAEAMTEVLMVGGGGGTERSETDRAIQRSHHRHFRHLSLSLGQSDRTVFRLTTGMGDFFRVRVTGLAYLRTCGSTFEPKR